MNNLQQIVKSISANFSELADVWQGMQLVQKEQQEQNIVPAAEMSEIETLVPEYLNEEYAALLNLPTIYRFNQSGLRYYFTVKDNKASFAPSTTTVIHEATPTSPGLQELRDRLGKEGYYAFMKERGHYGTLMHIFATDYQKQNKFFDTDTIPQRINEYVDEKNIRFETNNWGYSLNKDIRSIVQFFNDYKVKPIAIELIGQYHGNISMSLYSKRFDGTEIENKYSKEICFSGAIDLLCEMTIEEEGFFGETYKQGDKKGQPKESKQERTVIAIVDFKSGKNGFHPEHEMQLHMYKMMAEQTFGIEIDKLYNLAPKDWEGDTPTYSLKDQTESKHAERIPYLLGSYFCTYPGVKDILIMSGKLNGGNMSDCTKWVSASEWVLSKLGIKKEDALAEKALKVVAGVKNGKPIPPPMPDVMVKFGEALGVGFQDCTPINDELHDIAEQIKAKPVKLSGGVL